MASLDTLQQTLIKADNAYNNATTDEQKELIASDVKYLINQINTLYPDYKPEAVADTSVQALNTQLNQLQSAVDERSEEVV